MLAPILLTNGVAVVVHFLLFSCYY